MASAFLLRSRFCSDHLLPPLLQKFPQILIRTRSMGSGPRTFPGGLTKWQHKRVQEKLARQKAHRLLRTEKQLYLSRLRSEIRSNPTQAESRPRFTDQFTQPGAEDLWNEDDGPVKDPPEKVLKNPTRIPQLSVGSFVQKRGYSAGRKWRGNSPSEEESGMESESESESVRGFQRNPMFSTAALREYNVKKEKRPHRLGEERRSRSSEIQQIRDEFRSRKEMARMEERWMEPKGESDFTKKRFDEFGISPLTVKALSDSGYVHATIVQEASLSVGLEGQDVLVKARAGTGKTIAFLIPAIEAVLKAKESSTNLRVPPITALVLCPTRELAIQLTAEAKVLSRYHEGIGVQSLVGGTRFKLDQKQLESSPCQILVATPGRLLDHIENKTGFSVRLMGLKMLVLDEADHLLDLGFRKDLEKIVDCLPRQRQSMLFSATIPKEVRRVSQLVLRRDHVFVDTVGLGGVETPTQVLQTCLVVPHEIHFHMLYRLLLEHIMEEPDYKVVVFCTTAMVTEFTFVMLRDLKMNVREIHSRKPQLYRTRISDEFRESSRLILVTSDVTARGINYPDVTLVIQIGIPTDREQYIHRLGRTGRLSKSGKGILLLAPFEEYFLNNIKDLPVEKVQVPDYDSDMKHKVEESIKKVDNSIKEVAYHAWLGYYNSIADIGRNKTTLADLASQFSQSIGLEKPPFLFRKTALKMGLKDIPGIRIRK
ncbi:DEAD-box ATP-dependent RNA helicase 48 [Rhynchospora pubera]|uniref:ATP-dependent RNA helicase n=1 Tax=Rhynchospora pubera TaxID=906938 RepID=A0AAV8GRT9_9POAL|nr:DEAD-box ATP-dependent RNA helicase 48 [Rhynchospora pubera]